MNNINVNNVNLNNVEAKSTETNLAYGISLLCLEKMGPARLRKLGSVGDFVQIWQYLESRGPKEIAQLAEVKIELAINWKKEVRNLDPFKIYEKHSELEMHFLTSPDYPKRLSLDPEPPYILFSKGAKRINELLDAKPVVGIVGTRKCSRYGKDIAYELGFELSKAGAIVVSGLAYGIDTAAHSGSTEAISKYSSASPSVGVVASGLDIIYPERSRSLYEEVLKEGAIISETPLGFPPQKWKFPARNRIIAGLSDVVIVVESYSKGGSLITAEEAGIRGKPVLAVPGSIRSPASSGCNALIADGCQPLTDISDVFTALDMSLNNESEFSLSSQESLDHLSSDERNLLAVFCWEIHNLESLLQNTKLEFSELSIALEGLIQRGLVAKRGLNYERIHR